MNQQGIKEIVLNYYKYVDKGKIDELLSLFSDDIFYKRCGLELRGMGDFKKFYEKGRSIKGKHTIKRVIVNDNVAVVEGNFTGKWADGRPITIDFADIHFFNEDGKIYERHTYTDQGEV